MQNDYERQPKKSTSLPLMLLIAIMFFSAGYKIDKDQVFDDSGDSSLSSNIDLSEIEDVYDTLRKNYDGELDKEALEEGLKEGLVNAAGDPYTVYLDKEAAESFDGSLNGEFVGIGAELSKENDQLTVVAPISGFPADIAGVRAKDVIISIDSEDSTNISVEEAVSKIRGDKGTDVTLGIVRGNTERLDITITRDKIIVPSVEREVIDGNIGYLKISRFAEDTTDLAREYAKELKDQGVSSVILDLRNNSGGFLQSAVDVSGIWLDDKVVVKQRSSSKTETTEKTGSDAILTGMKTVVLVNEGSASASEIVAGALDDYEVATLVGTKTFGKGSVQALEELEEGSILKVTVARWYTPNDNNIDGDGIEPDEVIEFSEEDYTNDTDPQLDRAKELLN